MESSSHTLLIIQVVSVGVQSKTWCWFTELRATFLVSVNVTVVTQNTSVLNGISLLNKGSYRSETVLVLQLVVQVYEGHVARYWDIQDLSLIHI